MSDLKVVPISGDVPNAQNGENVVERLEQALDLAKGGGIDNCIVVMVSSNDQVVDCWANDDKPFTMIGALESLKDDFMRFSIESRSSQDD